MSVKISICSISPLRVAGVRYNFGSRAWLWYGGNKIAAGMAILRDKQDRRKAFFS
ncbi:hypothetical protein PAT3040_00921 [Paenibacillus agaridevorans]|uniref:Uncharacterized protein n=1 Tax=Paenibacillus agaridevorans TaxID=171404 RepID=A0A2R5EIG8_9BACL|nr:hypothetical protein PAT3040_00921 [Paenibacillus agaridevorans]